jgi:hypothetical protein
MTDNSELLTAEELPPGFAYPKRFLRLFTLGLRHLEPWYLLEGDLLRQRLLGLRDRYPSRVLVPFAARQDRDDIACWEVGAQVHVIHDFSSPGWEEQDTYDDVYGWLRAAVENLIQFDS